MPTNINHMEHKNQQHSPHSHHSLIGVGALWSDSFKLFGRKFKNLGSIALPVVASSLILSTLIEINAVAVSMTWVFIIGVLAKLFLLCLVVFSLFYVPALIAEITRPQTEALHAGYSSHDTLLASAYLTGIRKFFSYLWVMILVAAISFAGHILLIIPGIYVSVMLAFPVFALFGEGKKGTDALAASWKYVKGHWWSVFWRLLLLLIVVLISVIIALGVSSGLSLIIAHNYSLINTFFGIFDYLLLLPFSFVYMFLIYESLKKNHPTAPTAEETARLKRGFIWFFLIGILFGIVILIAFPGILTHIKDRFERALTLHRSMHVDSGLPNY